MKTKWHKRLSEDVSPAEDGEPEHWRLRDIHRRHVERMKSGSTGAKRPMPPTATRTRFLKSIRLPEEEKSITKPGKYSPKVGDIVTKTRWKGRQVRTLTLEERATCPRECDNWTTCYGGSMPWARRLVHGDELEFLLFCELAEMKAPTVIRLHQLGDFYSLRYVRLWERILERFDVVAFGYTAHPASSPIGAAIADLAARFWDRFAVRFSGRYQPDTVARAVTVMSEKEAADMGAIVCPAQLGKTPSCARCGLCWTSKRTIAFLEH